MPTTAGTGSEATPVIVITDTRENVKRMTRHPGLMADAAIVDYELTMSMPRPLTAYVGVDTLTHGMEAFVSRRATEMTNPLAESCIRLCQRFLRRAWAEGGDREAREGMSLAALQGGMAFGNASVALVHGMSRPLGAVFHLAHGLSNAVLLPTVTRFSWSGNEAAYAKIAGYLGVRPEKDAFVEALEMLNRDLEVPRLRECCGEDRAAFEAALPKMANDALASGSPGNNPVVPTAEEIIELYRQAW
jgi:alcohol dehydrogenase class IV